MWAKIGELWVQTHIVESSICHFVCTYAHNSKTKGRIRMLYLSNDCIYYRRYLFTGLEMYARYDRWIMDPNMHRNHFLIQNFVCTTHITWKLQVVHRCSTYWMTALLLEMSIFYDRAGCKMRLTSFGSKHALQSLSDKQFVCTCMWNLKTTGPIWAFCISNDCSTIGDISCVP